MKALRLFLVLVFVLSFAACAVKETNELVGGWQKEDGSVTIQFTKDGKFNLADGSATVSTVYQVRDKENLVVDLGLFGSATLKYAVAKDMLTLTDAGGNAWKFTRAQAGKEVWSAAPPKPRAEAPKQK